MQTIIASKPEYNLDWIDLVHPTPEEMKEVAEKYNLHPAALNDCLQPDHLPKYEVIDDVHFIILRIFDPGRIKEGSNIQQLTNKIALFFSKDFLLTIHRVESPMLQEVFDRYMITNKNISSYDLACKVVKIVLRSFEPVADQISAETDFYESRIFLKKRVPDLLKGLYTLKRRSDIGERTLYLSKPVLTEMEANKKTSKHVLQDVKDQFIQVHSYYTQMSEKLNNLLTLYLSISSQRTNEVMRVLTVFSAFFLPLTFIVGVYGMNFDFMPELRWLYGYPGVIILMSAITLLIFQWFRRKGWL